MLKQILKHRIFSRLFLASVILLISPTILSGQPVKIPVYNPALISTDGAKTATVILFLSPECPLCQSYSLTIRNLIRTYSSKGVSFFGIVPGREYEPEDIIEFQYHFQLKSLPIFIDPDFLAVKKYNASITPEVVVLNADGKKMYQGRIDNWAYELGRKRSRITEHDLKNTLQKLCNRVSFEPYSTKAVGCFIQ